MPPLGTQLRGRTKGNDVYAQVVSDPATKTGLGILFECKFYRSMSGAARAATGHSINGWQFWKCIRGHLVAKGTIRRLITDQGFGFIKIEQGEDLFFHCSELQGVDFDSLREGQEVEFEVRRGRSVLSFAHTARRAAT